MIDNDEEYDFLEEYALDENDYEWYEVYDEKQHLTDKAYTQMEEELQSKYFKQYLSVLLV